MSQSINSPIDPNPGTRVLGWAAFLACSWTWAIGMFLPVLLVRDMGPKAWAAFAIPNVLGAAAMAWLIRSPAHSDRHLSAHFPAMRAFSWVTIAFHAYFTGWLTARMLPGPVVAVAAVVGVFAILRWMETRWLLAAAWVVLGVSVGVAVSSGQQGALWFPRLLTPLRDDVYQLAVACLFGFALCPYLDLTFHRARQSTGDREAKQAFGLGFGVLFLAMITFTLFYAEGMAKLGWSSTVRALIGAHLAVQTGFTIAVHARELPVGWVKGTLAAAGWLALAAVGWFAETGLYSKLTYGEIGYRVLVACYAVAFPAYVWLAMVPSWREPVAPSRRTMVVWGVAVLLAMPLFWMAFVEWATIMAVPGVLILTAARIFVQVPDTGSDSPADGEVAATGP